MHVFDQNNRLSIFLNSLFSGIALPNHKKLCSYPDVSLSPVHQGVSVPVLQKLVASCLTYLYLSNWKKEQTLVLWEAYSNKKLSQATKREGKIQPSDGRRSFHPTPPPRRLQIDRTQYLKRLLLLKQELNFNPQGCPHHKHVRRSVINTAPRKTDSSTTRAFSEMFQARETLCFFWWAHLDRCDTFCQPFWQILQRCCSEELHFQSPQQHRVLEIWDNRCTVSHTWKSCFVWSLGFISGSISLNPTAKWLKPRVVKQCLWPQKVKLRGWGEQHSRGAISSQWVWSRCNQVCTCVDSHLEVHLDSLGCKICESRHQLTGRVSHFSSMGLTPSRQSTGHYKGVIHDVLYLVHIVPVTDFI